MQKFIFTLLAVVLTFTIRASPVNFQSNGFTLYGTLTIPASVDKPPPVVLFIHGSGPQDRNHSAGLTGSRNQCLYPGINNNILTPFKDLEEHLRNRGIATLRYDKRDYTYHTQLDKDSVYPSHFILDALNAVNFLKNHGGVDRNNIFVLGYEQGGTFLPVITALSDDVRGIISLATPSGSIDTVLADRVRYIETHCGDAGTADEQAEEILSIMNAIRTGDFPHMEVMGAYPNFWKEWLKMTDTTLKAFTQNDRPALFLHGTDDFQVPVSEWIRFQSQWDREDYTFQLLDGLNHYFTTNEEPRVSQGVGDSIASWIFSNYDPATNLRSNHKDKNRFKFIKQGDKIEIVATHPAEQVWVHNLAGQKLYYNMPGSREFTLPISGNGGIVIVTVQTPAGVVRKKVQH